MQAEYKKLRRENQSKRVSPFVEGYLVVMCAWYTLPCSVSQSLTDMMGFYILISACELVVHTSIFMKMRQDINENKTM